MNSVFCAQAELTFCTGDIIAVFGEIDEDGFYYVSVGNIRRRRFSAVYVLFLLVWSFFGVHSQEGELGPTAVLLCVLGGLVPLRPQRPRRFLRPAAVHRAPVSAVLTTNTLSVFGVAVPIDVRRCLMVSNFGHCVPSGDTHGRPVSVPVAGVHHVF